MGSFTAIDRVAGRFILSFGWRRALSAVLAGALSALALPPFDLLPVLFLTFPVWVWLIDSTVGEPGQTMASRVSQAFRVGWWFGFGYFLAGLWWIGNAFLVEAERFAWMAPLAVPLLPAGLALFWGAASAGARLLWSAGPGRVLALGAMLGLAEYLRGHILTGFPWNAVGYGAMPHPLLMQKAALLGVHGVTLVAVPVFAVGALLAGRSGQAGARRWPAFAAAGLVVALDLGYGAWRLAASPMQAVEGVSLRLVQPAIDQSQKWSPESQDSHFARLLELSAGSDAKGDDGLDGTDLLIWPETAMPFLPTSRPDALAAIADLLPEGTALLTGGIRVEEAAGKSGQHVYNSVYMISDKGVLLTSADKVRLVPFGEFLPLQDWAERAGLMQLTHLRGGFSPGARRPVLDAGRAGRLMALVCYEIIFPGDVLGEDGRPDWLLNVTNDAWFGLTPGPYQHWRQAVVRGVEEGLPVVRAANSGISSVTDPFGRIIVRSRLGASAVLDSPLPAAAAPTTYSKYGEVVFFLLFSVNFALLLLFRRSE